MTAAAQKTPLLVTFVEKEAVYGVTRKTIKELIRTLFRVSSVPESLLGVFQQNST